jgi:hypothetical protein
VVTPIYSSLVSLGELKIVSKAASSVGCVTLELMRWVSEHLIRSSADTSVNQFSFLLRERETSAPEGPSTTGTEVANLTAVFGGTRCDAAYPIKTHRTPRKREITKRDEVQQFTAE